MVQLLPVGSSDVEGVATLERATLQRELDITPTRVRIILIHGRRQRAGRSGQPGTRGIVQSGQCESPLDDVRVELESEDDAPT